MRQDDGSELLGANDPRSATIGIIHVAPNDDRPSVLSAILTQDKLGRKQVAVVLPEDNKAFQRPIDFEGLKNMRRGLKAQIVFVAPSGPGPAEFARQRRFPVYSSLESYAGALQTDGQGSTVVKRGWGFGRRQKPVGAEAALPPAFPQTNGIEKEPTHPLPDRPVAPSEQVLRENGAQAEHEDEQNHSGGNGVLLGGAGLATGLGLGTLAAGEHSNGSFPSPDGEDWDALPMPPPQTYTGNGSSSNHMQTEIKPNTPSSPSGEMGAGPGIIAFPRPQGRITDKLPPIPAVVSAPPVQPHPPAIQSSGRQRNSGKVAVVGAAGAAAGVGAFMAARGGVGAPPPPTRAGSAGGGGAAAGSRNRRWLLAAGLVLLTLLLIGGIALAAGAGGILPHIIPGTTAATVTITPSNTVVSDTYSIDAIPGGTTGKSQVAARILTSTKSQSGTVNATGVGHTTATYATGSLTFYNALTVSQTVGSGTVLTGADGVQVMNTQPAVIPAAQRPTEGFVTVAARAVAPGANGNISPLDINGACCLSGVTVQNSNAFTGGQNAQTFTVLSQGDVNRFASSVENSLTTSGKVGVTNQKRANEQLVGAVTCSSPSVTSSPSVGQATKQATVTVSVMCSGEAYDQQAAFALAQDSLMAKAGQSPGPGYALVGAILTTVKQASVVDGTRTVALLIFAEGRWVYQFSDAQKKNLANLIKGKSKSDAQALLLQQPGVSKVSIDIAGGGNTLPTDPTQISIVVQPIQGFPGTPTPTAGPGTPTSTPTSATPTPTPTPVNGLGGSGGGS